MLGIILGHSASIHTGVSSVRQGRSNPEMGASCRFSTLVAQFKQASAGFI